jgi:hypothetical protein
MMADNVKHDSDALSSVHRDPCIAEHLQRWTAWMMTAPTLTHDVPTDMTPHLSQVAHFLRDEASLAACEEALQIAISRVTDWRTPEATVFAERLLACPAPLLDALLGRTLAPRTCASLPISLLAAAQARRVTSHGGFRRLHLRRCIALAGVSARVGQRLRPAVAFALPRVQSLSMAGEGIGDAALLALGPTLAKQSQLQELDVSQCALSSRSGEALAAALPAGLRLLRL